MKKKIYIYFEIVLIIIILYIYVKEQAFFRFRHDTIELFYAVFLFCKNNRSKYLLLRVSPIFFNFFFLSKMMMYFL